MPPHTTEFSEVALQILRERYLQRDDAGKLIETPDGMLARVARAIAEPAKLFGEDPRFWEARFFERMKRLEPSQFSDPHECRSARRAARCLLCASHRR